MTAVSRPILSLIVVVYNMTREAPRTLFTLRSDYQNISPVLYEVIVIENGSSERLGENCVKKIDPRFKYIEFPPGNPSPACAINQAAKHANGDAIGILIDGARMLSPGVVRYALLALNAYPLPVISTLGCHLGPKPQQLSVAEGYNQEAEDILLGKVQWRNNGYKLFEIASLAGSCSGGVLLPVAESNCIIIPRHLYDDLGGYDERFTSAGGGLINLDFYYRALNRPNIQLVTLLGEATFHQYHGALAPDQVIN